MTQHFTGIVPDERWKNDVLYELRRMNDNMERLIELKESPEQEEAVEVETQPEATNSPKRGAKKNAESK